MGTNWNGVEREGSHDTLEKVHLQTWSANSRENTIRMGGNMRYVRHGIYYVPPALVNLWPYVPQTFIEVKRRTLVPP
jgi:hypothetical protein